MSEKNVNTSHEALSSLITIISDNLNPITEEAIEKEFRVLKNAWDSKELHKGTLDQLKLIIETNLKRIENEPGFRYFIVYHDENQNNCGVMARFPQTVVPVRIWKSSTKVYCCGNSLFNKGNWSVTAAPTLDSLLLDAARHDKVDDVERLLGEGADPNTIEPYFNRTPLLYATKPIELSGAGSETDENKIIKIVNMLIKAGADVNFKGTKTNDVTPLYCAVKRDLFEVVKILIANGADVNTVSEANTFFDQWDRKNKYDPGESLLWAAAHNRRNEIFDYLIEHGAVINNSILETAKFHQQERFYKKDDYRHVYEMVALHADKSETDEIKREILKLSKKWWQYWK